MAEHTVEELIAMRKVLDEDRTEFDDPRPGTSVLIKLMSPADRSVKFTLDLYEGKRGSSASFAIYSGRKTSMQNRAGSMPLVRVDIDRETKHTNPDGTVISGPHVHISSSEFGDRMAYPADSDEARKVIGSTLDVTEAFDNFVAFCNIDYKFRINWSLGV